MDKEQMQEISCMVITNAGEAFDCFRQGVEAALDDRFEQCDQLMAKGEQALLLAHKSQTDLLTAEMRGAELPFSILLVHAQDHLMRAANYQQFAKDTIRLYKKIKEK